MKKISREIIRYVIEFLIVAFGVYLGFYASDLQNEKKIQEDKKKSLTYIIEEL
jgi:large-conductance mechanosensitive channel